MAAMKVWRLVPEGQDALAQLVQANMDEAVNELTQYAQSLCKHLTAHNRVANHLEGMKKPTASDFCQAVVKELLTLNDTMILVAHFIRDGVGYPTLRLCSSFVLLLARILAGASACGLSRRHRR